MIIDSDDASIGEMLNGEYFHIPDFQRPYSWDKENVLDFWNDTIVEADREYFIGSMVLFEDKTSNGVVDGQQRLTTITLLLCAIRNHLIKHKHIDLADGLHRLIEREDINNKKQFVLKTETSYPYLQNRIQSYEGIKLDIQPRTEERALQAAYDLLDSQVSTAINAILTDRSLSADKAKTAVRNKLVELRNRLLSLKVIKIVLKSEEDAYLIFETLNTRGKDLNLADLVKNHLTKLVPSKNKSNDTTKLLWQKVVSTVEGSASSSNIDRFLHHYWLSKYEYLPVKRLFKSLKMRIKKSNAQAFLDELVEDAITYRKIVDPEGSKWNKEEQPLKSSLVALNLFKVQQPAPFALSLLRAYFGKKLSLKNAIEALEALEHFHFTFTAVTSQRSSGGISFMYALHARQLTDSLSADKAYKAIKDLKAKLKERVPHFDEFEALYPNIIFTNTITKDKKLIRYILEKIHRYIKPASNTDYNLLSIEHILPQSTNSCDDLVGQIGNLILCDQKVNERMKAKGATEKFKVLRAAGYTLNEFLIPESKSWGEEEIWERTGELAKLSYDKIWKI